MFGGAGAHHKLSGEHAPRPPPSSKGEEDKGLDRKGEGTLEVQKSSYKISRRDITFSIGNRVIM